MSGLDDVNYLMDNIIGDNAVPRNIKKVVSDAKNKVNNAQNMDVDYTSAIYALDEVINDINMPFHTRTDLMSIISELERMKEQAK